MDSRISGSGPSHLLIHPPHRDLYPVFPVLGGFKPVPFRTKVQLACDLIRDHVSKAKRTICLWDSWYTCSDLVEECRAHGYSWIGEIKGSANNV